MSVRVELLEERDAEEYDAFLRSDPRHLIYYSLPYRRFLERVLAGSEPRYLVVREGGAIAGALPLFVKQNARHGNVVNSLPFFGSHGGVVLRPGLRDADTVGKALVAEYFATARAVKAVAATLIDSPFFSNEPLFPHVRGQVFTDERIGQITELPREQADAEDALFRLFHQKTRNSVRKAQKSGLEVTHDGGNETRDFLTRLHRDNIDALGGLAKPPAVFRAIADTFTYDRDYRVYVAGKDGVAVGALLVLYYNASTEYFTPATVAAHRELQPMSLLAYEAMREAMRRGCRYWNWGGTWKSQTGVYQFKARWGTSDLPYRYHVDVFDPSVLTLSRGRLLAEYPHCYVAPFDRLSP